MADHSPLRPQDVSRLLRAAMILQRPPHGGQDDVSACGPCAVEVDLVDTSSVYSEGIERHDGRIASTLRRLGRYGCSVEGADARLDYPEGPRFAGPFTFTTVLIVRRERTVGRG